MSSVHKTYCSSDALGSFKFPDCLNSAGPVQGFASDLTVQDFKGNESSFMFLGFGSGIVVFSAARPGERDKFKGIVVFSVARPGELDKFKGD